MILSLLAFSPYAHGEFEKKLLAFLLKSCTKPYLNFIKNIMRGVIVDNQVEDFCGTPVSVNKDVNAATGKEILEFFLFCMYLGSFTLPYLSTKLNEYS